jgi:uncharacterized repeat protein (TIGR01451 family)
VKPSARETRRQATALVAAALLVSVPSATAAPVATQLDWDAQTWLPAGSLAQVYPIGSGNVAITWSGSTASLIQNRPQVAQSETGGLVPPERSLSVRVNYPASPSEIVATIDFTHPGGVSDVSFTVFDVDAWSIFFNPFIDQLQVFATDGVNAFNPSAIAVANPAFVTINGPNTVTGIANVFSASSPNGNVTFTFNQTGITRITLVYRSPPGGPANPGNQYISIHDINFTYQEPEPDLLVMKLVQALEDPVNLTTNPKAIPGATMGYTVQVTNTGFGATDPNTVQVEDPIPANGALVVSDYDGANPGPVRFNDGATTSGLSYTFTSLGSATDDVEFSDDGGSTWTYSPSDSGDGTDPAVTDIRIQPKGAFSAATGGGNPSFQALFKVRVD